MTRLSAVAGILALLFLFSTAAPGEAAPKVATIQVKGMVCSS